METLVNMITDFDFEQSLLKDPDMGKCQLHGIAIINLWKMDNQNSYIQKLFEDHPEQLLNSCTPQNPDWISIVNLLILDYYA